jgi:hypothetical protein
MRAARRRHPAARVLRVAASGRGIELTEYGPVAIAASRAEGLQLIANDSRRRPKAVQPQMMACSAVQKRAISSCVL